MITKNQIQFVKSLQQKKNRNEFGLFVVEGEKNFHELISSNFEIVEAYGLNSFCSEIENLEEVSRKDMERMSGMKTSPGIIAVVKVKTDPENGFDGLSLILDEINDPGNLGSIIRSADWFGIDRIITSQNTVEVWNPKVIQSSMGSVFRMKIQRRDLGEIIDSLKEEKVTIFGSSLNGDDFRKKDFPENCALIIGSESHGMRSEIEQKCDELIQIPSFGKAESLNAAMAATLLMGHIRLR